MNAPGNALHTKTNAWSAANNMNGDYQILLGKWGHYGGWDSDIHAGFLKLKSKFHDSPDFHHLCSDKLVATLVEVKAHDEWHNEYLRLREINRQEIIRWRTERNIQDKEKSRVSMETLVNALEVPATKTKVDPEKAAKIEQINQFKLFKQLRVEAKQIQDLEVMNRARLNQQVKNKYRETRIIAAAENKLRLQEEALVAHPKPPTSSLGMKHAHSIEEFQNRDKQLAASLEFKKAKKIQREQTIRDRLEMGKETVCVIRDPSRLLKPTLSIINRTCSASPAGSLFEQPVIQRRCVPSWRDGI